MSTHSQIIYVVNRHSPVHGTIQRSRYTPPDIENGPVAAFSNRRSAEMEVERLDFAYEYDYVHTIYELELKD